MITAAALWTTCIAALIFIVAGSIAVGLAAILRPASHEVERVDDLASGDGPLTLTTDAEADDVWADLLAAVGITPAEMRDRWEGRAR